MKVIFVAGPFRGRTPWEVEKNVRRAEELAYRIAELGASPLCPHSNTRYFDGSFPDAFWLEATSELLCRCDAVALVDGWENSEGTRAECELANKLGIPVFYPDLAGFEVLSNWIAEE